MQAAGLPINDQKITYRRSKTKIPHNKFIVRLKNGTDPVEVWTGSTNFTPSGFLGQTNVGHRVADAETARLYFEFWKLVKTDPDIKTLRAALATLTPNPAEVIKEKSVARLFSPRAKSDMLGWYGRRMLNAANSIWFTAAFGISKELVEPISQKRNQMRFVLMEKPTTQDQKKTLTADFNRVILSYGVPLGEIYRIKDGKATSRMPIKEFELDKWFFEEEHFRPKNDGFVFFVHTKFLLIDPLSDDPLVCSGSANFSSGSLLQNDENMLLVRGNTRVADIYMTEFDRIFRHFYFRDIANELAAAKTSDDAKAIFLDETDAWSDSYFKAGTLKSNRRLMFFDTSPATWSANAAKDATATPDTPAKPAKPAKKKTAKKSLEEENREEENRQEEDCKEEDREEGQEGRPEEGEEEDGEEGEEEGREEEDGEEEDGEEESQEEGAALDHEASAIDHEHRAGDVGSLVGGKPQDRPGDLARIGPASEQALARRVRVEILLRAAGGGGAAQMERGQRRARAHRIDANAVPRLLEGERLGQRHDAGLGDVVLAHSGARIDRMGGRDVDDAAAPAGAQVADGGTDERRVAQQIDREHALPGFALALGERLVGADAGEIDQHVDRAERLARRRDRLIGRFLARRHRP